ncbi:BA75_00207T0 [Komagataella pastoris]|uniref:GID complex catalytic subunit 2 n=1 Tax=Komagataella pastoris TaxID=4922 RepID=A0A1B2J6B4_PICPA|nr:BA75_00207T0 [Komagataella pastoris]
MNIVQEEVERLGKNKALEKCIKESNDLLSYLKQKQEQLNQDTDDLKVQDVQIKVKYWADQSLKHEKSLNTVIKKYQKSIDKVFNFDLSEVYRHRIPLESTRCRQLVDRALIMHLLRIGDFEAANTIAKMDNIQVPDQLLSKFHELEEISEDLTVHHRLDKAIAWANVNKYNLQRIGSDLQFNLHKLKFIDIYKKNPSSPYPAYEYAKMNFPHFGNTHLDVISKLMSSTIFTPNEPENPYLDSINLTSSPYQKLFTQLSRDFCSFVGLSSESPIFNTLQASYIAIPNFIKFNKISKMKNEKLDWTSENELPFEVELPKSLQFHSIFICPVSKEETTPQNSPMALGCRHLISKDSLAKLKKRNSSIKCPYCPKTFAANEIQEVQFI